LTSNSFSPATCPSSWIATLYFPAEGRHRLHDPFVGAELLAEIDRRDGDRSRGGAAGGG
jgi:hypothetical protein